MTSKIIVNTIEADTGISSVTFASNINLQNDSSILVSSSGVTLGTGSTIAAPSANEITLSTNSAERVRLTSAGNLGIGDASPTKPLTVGTTTPVILLDDQSSRTLEIRGPSATHNATVLTTSVHDLLLGTNNTERLRVTSGGYVGIGSAIPANVFDVQGTAHTKILIGTTGTGHATGIQITHAKGNAALQEWQLQTDGSADGNLKIRNATSPTDVMFFDADNNNVGINITNPERKLEVVDTNSNGSYPLAVSNHINATANKGAAIDFRLTTGGNTRGELGCKWTSNSSSDGTYFYIAPNDGATGNIERVRITKDGKVGINQTSPSRALSVYDAQSSVNTVLKVGTNASSSTTDGYAQVEFKHGSATSAWIWHQANSTTGFGGANSLNFYNGNAADYAFFSGGNNERFRIDSSGRVTTPGQPAFNCKLSTATGSNFTGFLVFGSVSYNIGNHYNSSNGRFTVPVDGRYLFSFYTNVEKGGSAGVVWGDWYVNGNARGNRFYTRWDGNWELLGGTIILDLDTNDYVQVYAATSGNWDGGSYGSYSGCLLG